MAMKAGTARNPTCRVSDQIVEEARAFFWQYHEETRQVPPGRTEAVVDELRETGLYRMTYDELSFVSKLAWRNSIRCNGRRFWRGICVNDLRDARTADEVYEGCLEHIRKAQNGGKLKPMITFFAPRRPGEPGIRLWNHQLLHYAAYRQADGRIIGDPMSLALTRQAQKLGWKGQGTPFDLLPIIVQMPGQEPRMYELPRHEIIEIDITHPDLPWFADLGLKWYGLPAIAEMMLDGGGLTYTCIPFSGWYMDTEIGSRNFGDEKRYNMLPVVAEKLGLSTKHDRNLWKDRALLELNVAVVHSFRQAGCTLVDHHTASEEFMRFCKQEEQLGRVVRGDWSWLVPPMSSSACPVFHREYVNEEVKPNFYYQELPYSVDAD